MGLDRPLRLSACVLPSRQPSAAAFEPEPAERFTESSADDSALTGPSPRDIYKKYNNTQKGVIVFMAEDMGLDRPLRLSACVLPSRQPSAAAFEPESAERFTESSADGSALTGSSPRDIYKK